MPRQAFRPHAGEVRTDGGADRTNVKDANMTTPYTTIVPMPDEDMGNVLTPVAGIHPAPDLDALADLHTRSVDALAGYETMVGKAEPEFRDVAERFRSIHARHVAALAEMLGQAGGEPDAGGSLMSTVNKAVVGMRALFDDIDAGVMNQIRSGEGHVLDAFDAAISAAQPADQAHLIGMRGELQGALDATSGLHQA
jgi:uncharacterized protein (TIGR02284 family)